MKQLLIICALLVILFSCKKEITPQQQNISLIAKIKIQLKDSISKNDFQELDFDDAVLNKFKNTDLSILRIPFLSKDFKSDFILLRIENDQSFSRGKIINLVKDQTAAASKARINFNGTILIYSLSRKLTTNSPITNGYVESFHPEKTINGKPLVVPVPYETMPEVVVVASYPPSSSEWSYSDWYNIQSFFNESNIYDGGGGGSAGGSASGGSSGGYYSSSGGGGYPDDGESPHEINPLLIDFEPVENLQPIDVAKYIKCFGNIPDQGATCTIKILTDIPVDSDPTIYFNTANGSPGHTFLQITKTNDDQVVQQNIGFYPIEGWKNIVSTLPVEGKFVDNADHEFNASLIMNLTPDQFQKTLTHIVDLSKVIKYDLAQSNCTDFALNVFNYQRGTNQLTIPPYNIPGDSAPNGTSTPQALYMKLKGVKDKASDPDSKNVTIPGVKGFAGNSSGACN